MADKEIKIGFEKVKLEALEFFLGQNNSSVEEQLKESLDKMYTKQVPSQVRLFVERNMNGQAESQESNEPVREETTPQTHRRRGQNASRASRQSVENSDVQNAENAVEQPVEENSETGMTMVM